MRLAGVTGVALAAVGLDVAAPAPTMNTQPVLTWIPLTPVPDAEGFAGAFAGVSNGGILFAGGSNFIGKRPWEGGTKQYYDTVYLLTSPHGEWRAVGKLPRPLGYGVSGSYGDELFVAGGAQLAESFSDAFALKWDGHELHRRPLPPLPQRRGFTGGTIAGHILYVACGLEAGQFVALEAKREVWALDLTRTEAGWRELPPLPGPGRSCPTAGAVDGNFYIFGGINIHSDGAGKKQTYLKDAYVYRPDGGWLRLADMPHAVSFAPGPAATTADGRIMIFTGDDGTRGALYGPNHPGFPKGGMLYDPKADSWTTLTDIPVSRATAPTVNWEGMWVIVSGERMPGVRSPEVWGMRPDGG
jgi:N-acetylneuraminate epimerase